MLAMAIGFVASSAATAAADAAAPTVAGAQIGFAGAYKLGCWTPIGIELQCGNQPWTGRVVVTVPDSDGVPTEVSAEVNLTSGEVALHRQFIRVGQAASPIDIALVTDDGTLAARRSLYLGTHLVNDSPSGLPATNRLLVEFGPSLDLEQTVPSEGYASEHLSTRIARVEQATDLPTEWYGYESAETLFLTTSQPELFRPLAADQQRIAALHDWLDRGGQLVLFCAANAEELLIEGGVLASFAPGKFDKIERLTQPQPLETFSGSEQAITANRRIDLSVPRLVDVEGSILASAGRSKTNTPLVVRTPHGLGEVIFVGLDFDRPPLADWPGRTSFLRRLLDWGDRDQNAQSVEQQDAQDLSGHLRNSLDKQFVGVQLIPFGVVAFLVGGYLLLIGPGDFLFVRRLLNRPALTWLTFPLLVVGMSVLAYSLGTRSKGDQLRVNQVEIVDVDCTDDTDSNAFARGTVWTHFFTPQVESLDLQLQPSFLGQPIPSAANKLVTWLGLPGYALGGMQASGAQTAVFDEGYLYDESFQSLRNLPVQVWSTKTLTARWSGEVDPELQTALRKRGEELLAGTITNNSDVEFTDCALLYGRWAYDLGRLPAGRTAPINDSLSPRTVKTLLTNSTAGDETVTRTAEDGTVPFATAEWDVARLLKVMMFYEAVNGSQYTNMVHRYQPFVDLSTTLEYDERAILLARSPAPSSQWQTETGPLASDEDQHWVYYRLVVSVDRSEGTTKK